MKHSANICLVVAIVALAIAAALRWLVVLHAITLTKPIDGALVASGLVFLALAFVI